MRTQPFSIMHISDLHRSPRDPITNDELISALVHDRDRYLEEEPRIPAPEAIVVSGDIIQGVPLYTEDFAEKIEEQYSVADEFLTELVHRFLSGDRSRLVMVPGNHDVDWNTAFSALEEVNAEDVPPDLRDELYSEDSLLRWDWKNCKLYRIVDRELYANRLCAFWRFYDQFYSDGIQPPTEQKLRDTRMFVLCEDRIGVAAYNSCHGNDCFAFHGMIEQGSIARSDLDLRDSGKVLDLRIAVWHHSIQGSPYRTDYMDVDVVRGMIGRGFRLGLHGHEHKALATAQEIHLPDSEKMAVVSAGSLCAGSTDLPVGTHRQYNVLEIGRDFCSVRAHVRTMEVANLFSPARLIEFGGISYVDLTWNLPRNAVGGQINTRSIRKMVFIEEAEKAAKTGKPERAVGILKSLNLTVGSYERELYLNAALDAKCWRGILDVINPPTSINELVLRVTAYLQLDDPINAKKVLDSHSSSMRLPESLESDLRYRISVKEALRR